MACKSGVGDSLWDSDSNTSPFDSTLAVKVESSDQRDEGKEGLENQTRQWRISSMGPDTMGMYCSTIHQAWKR